MATTTNTTTPMSTTTTTTCILINWQWLWLSWKSGRFLYQRSAVRIQTPANFHRTFIIYCQLYFIENTKIKEKEAGNGPFLKKIREHFIEEGDEGLCLPQMVSCCVYKISE